MIIITEKSTVVAMRFRRIFSVLAAGAALAACAPADQIKDKLALTFTGCADKRPTDVNWSAARTFDVTIRQDEFQPMVIGLVRDRPYVLHIRNGDSGAHSFRSPAFFRQAAVAEVIVDGQSSPLGGECITGVSVPAKGSVEIRLVALLEGRYSFDNLAWHSLSLYDKGSGIGTIIVQ